MTPTPARDPRPPVTRERARDATGGSRLTWADVLRVGSLGLRSRRMRATLSALGISIGIAAIVGVLGISQTSKASLLAQLGALGNLATVQPASNLSGQQAELPTTAQGMAARIGPVTSVASIGETTGLNVYRSPFIPAVDNNGIVVTAASPTLPATVGAKMVHGRFLSPATARYPAVVLGSETAILLGISNLAHPAQVWLGGRWFTVVGILGHVPLQAPMDTMAFIGFPVAEHYFAFDGHPTELFVRADPAQLGAVAAVLPATVDPQNPPDAAVSYPADILQAEIAAKGAYNGLFLGLGAVALLVGGIGIANVMVISVLERRPEIGLRRALGATRRHIAEQFVTEALLLSLLGGLAGTVIGTAATWAYALAQHSALLIPPQALYGGLTAAISIGAIAGLYPATRAARLSPSDALRTI